MICPTCLQACTAFVKGECKSCYTKTYGKRKRLEKRLLNSITLTTEQKEVLQGLMLGDGCLLYSSKESKNPRLAIVRKSTDVDYLQWQLVKLQNLFNSGIKHTSNFDERTNKTYYKVYMQSKSLSSLKEVRDKWYTNNIKIIPPDLKLTPLICLIWFCDDGSIIHKSIKSTEIKLSTHSFSLKENEFLVSLLNNELNQKFRIVKDNSNKKEHYYIAGSTKAALAYINYIDDIFPDCMSRKSDKWRLKELWDGIKRGPYK